MSFSLGITSMSELIEISPLNVYPNYVSVVNTTRYYLSEKLLIYGLSQKYRYIRWYNKCRNDNLAGDLVVISI